MRYILLGKTLDPRWVDLTVRSVQRTDHDAHFYAVNGTDSSNVTAVDASELNRQPSHVWRNQILAQILEQVPEMDRFVLATDPFFLRQPADTLHGPPPSTYLDPHQFPEYAAHLYTSYNPRQLRAWTTRVPFLCEREAALETLSKDPSVSFVQEYCTHNYPATLPPVGVLYLRFPEECYLPEFESAVKYSKLVVCPYTSHCDRLYNVLNGELT